MSAADYSVGSRVYRGASNAPTRGTVDPMGYINRSLASPVGGDGMSDKRSGLAQAAMDRLRGGGMSQQQQPMPPVSMDAIPPAPGPKGFIVSPTGKLVPQSGTPLDDTMQSMYGAPIQASGPSEPQLMQAARDRLMHHTQTKEIITKHQLSMEKLAMQAAEMINKHKERLAPKPQQKQAV